MQSKVKIAINSNILRNILTNREFTPLIHKIHLGHLAGFDGVDDIDVGLHGVVGGVACPFHNNGWGDAAREGVDDKGTAPGMGSNANTPP